MNLIYNNQEEIATKIKEFLLKVFPSIRKTQLKIIPYIVLGMILSESTVASDISKELKGNFSLIQHDSIIKRIKRFFTNKLFNPYDFYDKIIRYVISTYKKKHDDKRIHIIFDHMFSHENYTVFMISMRIGKQGIPLWFRCFKGKNDSNAFAESLLKEGISYVSNLFDESYDLIFLADRWFNSTTLMEHINSLGHTYCFRLKGNITVFDKQTDNYYIKKNIGDLKKYIHHANWLYDIPITMDKYKINIAISNSINTNDPWIIATNGDPKRAIKDYSYRFGGIESIFKNQKSNGLYMESTVKASLKYFESMYTIACFTTLFLTLFGADYTKNTKSYRKVKLKTHKKFKDGTRRRVMSLFNIGLTLFKLAYNSNKYIRIPFLFTLYDI